MKEFTDANNGTCDNSFGGFRWMGWGMILEIFYLFRTFGCVDHQLFLTKLCNLGLAERQ